ncbi:AfsA-related hotdog domain-containing protein [Streptomyces longwoodensis]|uniref:AfsA-related hotdog domain-containing protein n=1 Tax=Streptomyces longwoodensis TaxID=68231 RepID=UPI0033DBA5A3
MGPARAGVGCEADVLISDASPLPGGQSFRVRLPGVHDHFGDRGGGLPDDALLVRSLVEQCAYAALQDAELLRDGEVPLNTCSHARITAEALSLGLRGGLLASCRVDEHGHSRTGRTRRVSAVCVLTAPDGRVLADGETRAGVLDRRLYRAWRGPSVVRAGSLAPAPAEPSPLLAPVRRRPENQVLTDFRRGAKGHATAQLRLSSHRYLLPAPADHVTGRLFAEATRQVVLTARGAYAVLSVLRLSFPRLCTLEQTVSVHARPDPGSSDPGRWRVVFRQAGDTVCAAAVRTSA